jgi:hypothetical protein
MYQAYLQLLVGNDANWAGNRSERGGDGDAQRYDFIL